MSKLQNFDYQNVALKEGHWKKQRDELIETYLKIEDDDMLHPFRKLANLPNKGHGLVGWYGSGASTFGQKLGAFAKLYLVTGDIRLKEKAIRLADGWGECLAASDSVADCNGTYNYDKLMGGFLDLYEYLGYEPAKEYVRALTKSADARLDKEVCRDGLQIMSGDMIEWYTLPEQIYRAYQLTGEQLYLDFAKVWDYDYFWEKLLAGDFKIGPRHAYSHVNSLSSAAMAYETTKNEEYLHAIEIAYKVILDHHTFATGGYGPAECLFADEEGYLGDSIKASWDADKRHIHYRDFGNSIRQRDDRWGSCEVSCCSWAVFKLTRYLMELTGEAGYGGWAEKLLYNGCGGQPPITQDGKVMYYADYFINGGLKSTEDGRLQDNGASFEWQCCTGTFPQDVAEYANLLYYHSEDGLFVSQYLPSDVTFSIGDKQVRLENTSFYPKEKELRFVVHAETPVTTALHFRVPSWATGSNLDNLGLEVPTTLGELKDVLVAFRDNDANGNGDASDEIPMDFNGWFGAAYSLTNLIGSYGIQLTNWGTDGYFVEDGQVKNYAVDERYKALISYLADLYSEGLINENAITNDYSMFQSLSRGDENGDALVGVVLGWEETDKFGPTLHDQYVPCGPFADDVDDLGTDEPRWTYDYSGLNMSSNRICMSANCANPEAAMKFMNEFYDSEVSVEVLFGGISDGCLEKTGDDSYKVLDPLDPDTDSGTWKWTSSMADNGPMYIRRATTIDMAQDMTYALEEREQYKEAIARIDMDKEYYPQMLMKYTSEDQNNMAVTQANVTNVTDAYWGLWLTGESNIEDDWDSYVEEVNAAGLQDILAIRQASYDSWKAQ